MSAIHSKVLESNYFLFKTDRNGNVLFVDPALLEQVAKSENEVKGKHCNQLLPLNNTPLKYENIFEAVQTHQIWEGEVSNAANNQSISYQMAVTTSFEEDNSDSYIFILTPKGKSNPKESMALSGVDSGSSLLDNQFYSVMPAEYKMAFTVALSVVVMLCIKDASLIQASVLIGLLLAVLVPILATGMILDKWVLKSEKQALSGNHSLTC